MENFWDFSVWGFFNIFAILLFSLLVANALKKSIKFLNASLIPTSVIGGLILLIIAAIYKSVFDIRIFDTEFFGGNGSSYLEMITYHALALGFVSASLKHTKNKVSKERVGEIINTGVTTVSTYLLQGVVGMVITIVTAMIIPGFFKASGILLPFGYGQGTGQAMNYGNIFEIEHGFDGGKSFGLTIAAMGFIAASIGGVIHLNIMRHKGKIKIDHEIIEKIDSDEIQSKDEIPMQESIDKFTIQIALITLAYLITFVIMWTLGMLLPGMRSTIYGFNFLLGVLSATLVKGAFKGLKKIGFVKKEYTNNFLLTRASNFFYDVMVVAGIAAIRVDIIEQYWGVLIILGVVGLFVTYTYNRFVAVKLFPHYKEEQFLVMYGMLTGTASTGIILLREIDGEFKTPAADNLVYQNFPAIILGFPMMFLATWAPVETYWTLAILAAFFVVLNFVLFRKQIFGRRRKAQAAVKEEETV